MLKSGICLLKGIGIEKDISQGGSLVEKSATLGCSAACWRLYVFYPNGTFGFPSDVSKAKHWCYMAQSC